AEQRSQSWLNTYLRVNKYLNYFDEYIPNTYLQYYFFPEEIVEESDPKYTRADEAKDSREKEVWEMCAKAEGANSLEGIEVVTNSVFGDLMIELAESIAYDLHKEFILLTKNNGIIPNFNSEAIIEVAGTFGKNGAEPFHYGDIKPFYKGLMEAQYAYELLTVEAYLEQDYTKALQALTLNRTIVNPEKAQAVLKDLMEANKDYWTLK
ncbi:MAG: 6-phospho-alpha-glucosidase, partial [Clostridiaceae bacterium]